MFSSFCPEESLSPLRSWNFHVMYFYFMYFSPHWWVVCGMDWDCVCEDCSQPGTAGQDTIPHSCATVSQTCFVLYHFWPLHQCHPLGGKASLVQVVANFRLSLNDCVISESQSWYLHDQQPCSCGWSSMNLVYSGMWHCSSTCPDPLGL